MRAVESFTRDLTLALRSLLRERGVSAVAIGSLAIGIAANATIFSLVQAVEFPQLIYPDASRIVFLESRNLERNLSELPISAPDGLDVAAATRTLVGTNLTDDDSAAIREAAVPARYGGRQVTPEFFRTLGIGASQGRTLAPGDRDAVVLSDTLWRQQFGADAGVLGRTIHLNDRVVPVVGVMPPRFDPDADYWILLPDSAATARRDARRFTSFARLAPGATLEDADRELAGISANLSAQYPATNAAWVTFPRLLTRLHGQDSRGVFFLLQGAVAFVLLIACANIANILLARGTLRRHEMALRTALGASRGRLLRQLLTESLLLAALGGALGLGLATWGIRLARAIGGFPPEIDPHINGLVLGFSAAVSIITGVICGIVPALRMSRTQPEAVLRGEGGRGETTAARGRLRAALVVVQVASAVVLVTSAGLMLRTFANRERVDLGFDPGNAVRADLVLSGQRYADAQAQRRTVDDVIDRLRQSPGVRAAGASAFALSPGAGARLQLTLPDEGGRALPPSARFAAEAVTPNFFAAMGVPIRQGRGFTSSDGPGAEPVAIINDELARSLWPERNPIGARIRVAANTDVGSVFTIVGVVSSVRRSAMHDFVLARVYVPLAAYPSRSVQLVVRAPGGDAGRTTAAMVAGLRQADPALVLDGLRTVEEDLARFLAPVRLITLLLDAFGLAGLLLAALGVFGTMSYAVSQRRRELAVRSALGASRGRIAWLVLRAGLMTTAIGLVPGILAALAAGRALSSFLFGVTPADPVTFGAAVGFLALVALAACARPAHRAASTDPMTILRRE